MATANARLGNDRTPTLAWLPIIIDRIVRDFDPMQIVLFGSQARSQARWDSDIDLLVILRDITDHRRAAVEVMRTLRDLPVGVDVIVATPEDVAQRGNLAGSVLRSALHEGTVVHAA